MQQLSLWCDGMYMRNSNYRPRQRCRNQTNGGQTALLINPTARSFAHAKMQMDNVLTPRKICFIDHDRLITVVNAIQLSIRIESPSASGKHEQISMHGTKVSATLFFDTTTAPPNRDPDNVYTILRLRKPGQFNIFIFSKYN